MTGTNAPNPTDWHRKPKGEVRQCRVCGYPGKYRGEHRLTLKSEGYSRKWLRRDIVTQGDALRWKIVEVGMPWGKISKILTAKKRERIAQSARLAAQGFLVGEIAERVGVDVSTIYNYERHHAALWRHDFRIAVEKVRAEEKSKPAVEEPDNRTRLPNEARWSPIAKAAIPAEPGSMELRVFLKTVYIPSRLELNPETVKQLTSAIKRFSDFLCRPACLVDLTEVSIRAFLSHYLQMGMAGATVNSKRRHLLALWRCAHDEELLDREPRARKIPQAKAAPKIPEAWNENEFARIMDSAKRDVYPIDGLPAAKWWEAFLLVLYDTGERFGAVLQATPQDVVLDEGWICFLRTKTGKPRFCPLHPDTVAAVRRIYNENREVLFPWPFSRAALAKRFCKILKRAGVRYGQPRGGLFHKIRRSSGSLVEMHGGSGSAHIGNTERVFREAYHDPRFRDRHNLDCLPRPMLPPLLTCEKLENGGFPR